MKVLGIESSCDEFAAAVLDGKTILGSKVSSQIEAHKRFGGVAPEVASRLHGELAMPTIKTALQQAGMTAAGLDAIAYTNRPGLIGSLLVGASIAKSMAWSLQIPFIAVDHIQAHLYVNHLIHDIAYPYLGVVVSGGHTALMHVEGFGRFTVIGSSIDDACGECYDKVAKHYGWGFPGGPVIDKMAAEGDAEAYRFPYANLYKGDHRYDLSYSGLKNAAINQLGHFHIEGHGSSDNDIAASFQKAAIGLLLAKIKKGLKDFNLRRIAVGGGVAANSYLRTKLAKLKYTEAYYPPPALCADNGEMIAWLGQQLLEQGARSSLDEKVYSRVLRFKRGLKQA
jgi:N6-L-threonylcarbamoyladenine synthase